MKTYFCLMSEFYDDGSVKAAVISRACKEKSKNTSRELLFADCYRDWYNSESAAKQALAQYLKLGVREGRAFDPANP